MDLSLPDFSKGRVVVAGDLMLDRYWSGETARISPEAPVPVVRVQKSREVPGGAGNVALNVAALGAHIDLLGFTGEDVEAAVLEKLLRAKQVTPHFEAVPDLPTITKLRVMSLHQQLLRMDFEELYKSVSTQELLRRYSVCLRDADVVILSDYGKGTLTDAAKMIALAQQSGRPVLVDPKGADFSRYRGASLLTPNFKEFVAVVGECDSDEDIVYKGQNLLEEYELGALLVTRGSRGMTLLQANAEPLHLTAQAREVYDVTGAGDTVISTIASSFAAGKSLAESVAIANIAAGVVVGKVGTATVSPEEIKRKLQRDVISHHGVVSEAEILELSQEAKSAGKRVVMTNGCFDILHPGHVTYLEQAKALGDYLIVAVNDDDSVKRLKGDGRPVNALSTRMHMLAALKAVDWVVSFSEDTPRRLIEAVSPDVLVKGGDYTVPEVAGSDHVLAQGGKVEMLAFVEGFSTTGLLDKIKS